MTNYLSLESAKTLQDLELIKVIMSMGKECNPQANDPQVNKHSEINHPNVFKGLGCLQTPYRSESGTCGKSSEESSYLNSRF